MKVTGPVVPPTPPTSPSPQTGQLPPEDVRYAAIEHGLGSSVAETGQKVVSAPPPVGAVGSTDPQAVLQQELQYLGDLAQMSLLYAQQEGQCISPYGTNGSPNPPNPNLSSEISALGAKIQAEFKALPTGDPLIFPTSSLITTITEGDPVGFTNMWAADGANSILMINIFGVGQTPSGGWMNNLSNLQLSTLTPQQQSQAAMNVYMLQLSAMAFEPQMYASQFDQIFWGANEPSGTMSSNFHQVMYAALWFQENGGGQGTPPANAQFGTDLVNLGYMMGAVEAGLAQFGDVKNLFPNFYNGAYSMYSNLLNDVIPGGPNVPSSYTPTWPPVNYTWLTNPNMTITIFISGVFEPMYHP
jgi:hypothetical protein